MIYLELFWTFLKIGCFTFGGAYGSIPLMRDAVMSHGWMGEADFAYMIAVSESTPGPIMVNLATYIGSDCAGVLGALVATLAVVLPAFVAILILCALLNTFIKNKYVQAALRALKACVIGIVLATGALMILGSCIESTDSGARISLIPTVLTAILLAGFYLFKHALKKKPSPILFILASAVLGAVAFGF